MSFSDRFINVMDGTVGVPGRQDFASHLVAALSSAPVAGPCTLYIGRSAVVHRDVEIDERFDLWMGPGAVLRIDPGVTLTVLGTVDLAIEPRFHLGQGARVRLLGPIDAVRPEWWDVDSDVDGALAAAFSCLRARFEGGRARVPLRLLGPYRLSETFVLDASGPTGMEVILEGRHPRGDAIVPATFSRQRLSAEVFPLLRLGPDVRLRVTRVAFDATGGITAKSSGARSAALLVEGVASGLVLDRCTFFVASGDGVLLQPTAIASSPPAAVAVQSCWFQVERGLQQGAVALRVAEPGTLRLRVDGTVFRGSARAMVAMVDGICELVGCDFDNFDDTDDAGVDLSFGSTARVGKPSEGNPVGPLLVSAIHTVTSSYRHIEADRRIGQPDSVVTITGLLHRPRTGVNPDPVPAVRWQGPVASGLLLQGSRVSGTVSCNERCQIVSIATIVQAAVPFEGTYRELR
jgi:hypothetical protein